MLSLFTLAGVDLLGWSVATQVWLSPAKAIAPVSKAYAALPGPASNRAPEPARGACYEDHLFRKRFLHQLEIPRLAAAKPATLTA